MTTKRTTTKTASKATAKTASKRSRKSASSKRATARKPRKAKAGDYAWSSQLIIQLRRLSRDIDAITAVLAPTNTTLAGAFPALRVAELGLRSVSKGMPYIESIAEIFARADGVDIEAAREKSWAVQS